MADEVALDELGPVDYLVVEFPAGASNFAARCLCNGSARSAHV